MRRPVAPVELSVVAPPLLRLVNSGALTSPRADAWPSHWRRVRHCRLSRRPGARFRCALRLPKELELRKADLLSLCRLVRLRALEVDSSRCCGALAIFSYVGDGDLLALVAAMPRLRLLSVVARALCC